MLQNNAKLKASLELSSHPKVKKLLENRALDDDTGLPEIPSAQLWRNFTQEEKDDFIAIVEKQMKWGTYEQNMKACWPKEKKWKH